MRSEEGDPRSARNTDYGLLVPLSKIRGQWAMFGTLFEGMGNTKVRSLAQSRNLTNKDDLKLGSHGKSWP